MAPRRTRLKTILLLALGTALLNLLLLVWSLFDAFFLVRAGTQAETARVAERLAAHLAPGSPDPRTLQALLADLAPHAAVQAALIGDTTLRIPLAPRHAERAPVWYATLLTGERLESAALLPGRAERLVLAFDGPLLTAPLWRALRTPWWASNVVMVLFLTAAGLWLNHRLRRLRQAPVNTAVSPLLRELLREERPGAARAALDGAPQALPPASEWLAAAHCGAALLVIDRAGAVSYANPAAERLFGYETGELAGKPAARLVPPWNQHELEAERARHAPAEIETQRLTRRGQLVDVLWHSEPLPGPAAEEPPGRVWTLWDISQRKREETVLRLLGRSAAFSQEGVIITDAAQDNAVIFANEAVTRITGYTHDELLGRNPRVLYGDQRNQEGITDLNKALAGGGYCRVLLHNRRKDGTPFWNELSLAPITDAAGRVTHHAALIRDVTERREQVQELLREKERLHTVIDGAPLAICITDPAQTIRAANPCFTRLFAGAEPLVGRSLLDLLPPEAWEKIRPGDSGPGAGGEINIARSKGEMLTLLANTATLGTRPGPDLVLFMLDITGRKRTEQALAVAKERAQITLESIGDGVITTHANGVVDYLNPVAERLTGWVKEDVQGMPVADVFKLLDEETREPLRDPVERALRLGRTITVNRRALLVSSDQREFGLNITATPIRDREQRILGAVVVFRDVSESRAAERQITYQARNDALTGLYNRREFQDRLVQALASAREENKTHAVGYMDLDKFKIINDSCGHGAGDEVLKQVAALLHSNLRANDILARLGGDEFAMLLDSCSLEVAERLADQIRTAIHDYRFVWQDRVFELGVSIGLLPITADSGTLDEVLHNADTACYMAKNEGRNRVHVFRPDEVTGAESLTAGHWLQRIREGIEQDRFVLFEVATRRLVPGSRPDYHPIRLRLREESGELLDPSVFMPTAARYHLLGRIDEWVVSTLLAHLGRNRTAGRVYGVTLSGQTLIQGGFAEFVAQQLERSGAPADALCFELDETDVLGNLTTASALMQALKALGCRLAIADFGYGRASFAHLHALPVDFLKIESSVIHAMGDSPVDYVIAEAVSRVGQMMHMGIIATGVDDARILAKLAGLQVDYAEGDHFDSGHPFTD